MNTLLTPLSFLLVCFAGWMNRRQQAVIESLQEEVRIAGIVPEPEGHWMNQMARNLTDAADGFLRGYRYLIQDRSSLFTEHYHQEKNHQGLESKIIRPEFAKFPDEGSVHRPQRLGGLLNYYYYRKTA